MAISPLQKKQNAESLKRFNNLCLIAKAKSMPFDTYIRSRPDYNKSTDDLFIDWMHEAEKQQQHVKQYVSPSYFAEPEATIQDLHRRAGVHDAPRKKSPVLSEVYLKHGAALRHNGTISPAFDKANKYRHRIKYSVSFAPLPYVQHDGGLRVIHTINAVAPNLMGSSPKDESTFLKNVVKGHDGKIKKATLNSRSYQAACEEIANLAALSAKDNSMKGLVVADFGLGVYLNKLSPDDKSAAREIMQKAYANATANHGIKLKWVVWEADPHQKYIMRKSRENLIKYPHCQIAIGDIITGLNELASDLDGPWAVINNGSDRTIGGAKDANQPTTTEEQVAQASLLLAVLSNLNSHVNDCIYKVSPEQLKGKKPLLPKDAVKLSDELPHHQDTQQLANHFANLLGKPVHEGQQMQYFAFNSQHEAQSVLSEIQHSFPKLTGLDKSKVHPSHEKYQFGLTNFQVAKILSVTDVYQGNEHQSKPKVGKQHMREKVLGELKSYKAQRKSGNELYIFRSALSFFVSQRAYTKTIKLSAASKLEQHINGRDITFSSNEIDALKEGSLGNILKNNQIDPCKLPVSPTYIAPSL